MTKQEIINHIMNSKESYTHKPRFLIHEVDCGMTSINRVLSIFENGLKASFSDWEHVSAYLPHRPKGNFFYGEHIKHPEYDITKIKVFIKDIDTEFLYAFPANASYYANELANDGMMIENGVEALKEIKPVKYKYFNCEFEPEWIYTLDIPKENLHNKWYKETGGVL